MFPQWFLIKQQAYKVSLAGSLFFAGLLIGNVVFGPLSDKIGRRPVYLTGEAEADVCALFMNTSVMLVSVNVLLYLSLKLETLRLPPFFFPLVARLATVLTDNKMTSFRFLRVSLIACQTLKHLLEDVGDLEKVISTQACFFSRMAANQQEAHRTLNFIYRAPVYSDSVFSCVVLLVAAVRDGLLDFSVFTLKHFEPTAVVLLCKLN